MTTLVVLILYKSNSFFVVTILLIYKREWTEKGCVANCWGQLRKVPFCSKKASTEEFLHVKLYKSINNDGDKWKVELPGVKFELLPKESFSFSSSRLGITDRTWKIGEKIRLHWKFPTETYKIHVHSTGIENVADWVHDWG